MNIFRKARKDLNMTRPILAMTIGVPLSTVGRWELGKDFPTPYALKKLSKLTGIPEETFIKEAGSLPG